MEAGARGALWGNHPAAETGMVMRSRARPRRQCGGWAGRPQGPEPGARGVPRGLAHAGASVMGLGRGLHVKTLKVSEAMEKTFSPVTLWSLFLLSQAMRCQDGSQRLGLCRGRSHHGCLFLAPNPPQLPYHPDTSPCGTSQPKLAACCSEAGSTEWRAQQLPSRQGISSSPSTLPPQPAPSCHPIPVGAPRKPIPVEKALLHTCHA